MTERFNQPLGGNEMPRFGGPATMMRMPTQEDTRGLDACFVGIPFDIGTSNRSGARFGPRAIRNAIRVAVQAVETRVVGHIERAVADADVAGQGAAHAEEK